MKPAKVNNTWKVYILGLALLFAVNPVLAKDKNEDLTKAMQEVEQANQKHIQALNNLLGKVPDNAKPSIEHAIAVSQRSKNIAVETAELSQTDDPLKKAELHRKHAEKRITEIQDAQRKGKPEIAEELAGDYGNSIDEAQKEIAKAKGQGKNTDKESLALEQSTSRHTQVLTGLLSKVPEQGKKGIMRALEASQRGKHKEAGRAKQAEKTNSAAVKKENAGGQKKQQTQKKTNENRQGRKSEQNAKSKAAKGRR